MTSKYSLYVTFEDYFYSYSIETAKNNDMLEFDNSSYTIKTVEEIHTNDIQVVYNQLRKYFSFGVVYEYIFKNYGSDVANSIVQ